jgi:AbrB family looped-hinge helix DNA binding protein
MSDKMLATITSKGQITLPAELRKAWDLKPGDQIAFDPPGATSSVIEPRRRRSIFDRLEEFKLPSLGRPLTQQDIEDSITEAMNEQEERSRALDDRA